MNTTWQLAQRQIRSQWRRADWLTLMLSLFMMTALVTLLTTTSDRLYSSLTAQSADILGADLSLHSQQPINAQKIADAQALGLTSSPVIQFISMAESDEGNVLSTVRAVREPYPLRGTIETRPADNPGFPAAGTVWADQSLLDRLSLSLGDKLYLGYSTFTLSHIIEQSPDRGRGFANFNPQIIMRADELAATEILAPGSRADYRLLISGEAQAIAELESKWKPALAKGQRLLNARDDSQLDGSSVANASRYLKLSALLSLLLGAVAILLSLQRYSADQRTRSALLLSLGMTPRQLVTIYCWQLFIGWLVAAVIGTIAGYALHQVIAAQLSEYLPHVANLSISSIVTSPLLALAILFILGLPTLLPLGRISIMQMLRAEKRAASNRWHYIACAALLLLAIGLYMGSFVQALVITALLLGLGWIAGFIAQHSINFAIHRLFSKLALAPLLKLRLRQQRHWHRLQAGVFSLLLAILAVLFFVRNDLIGQWQSQLPENTPNQFAVNIQPSERDRLESWMTDNELEAQLFPIVRGRITHLNKQPVADVLSQEQLRDHALRRELNLTWQTELAEQNAVLEGTWNPQVPGVSIERELSEELGFKLGDTIGITIGSQQLHAPVTSIRNVEWGSFKPNFFMIFTPQMLEDYPATYITSFNIPEEKRDLSAVMARTFPTITLVDIEKIFKQAQEIIAKLADSATLVMLLTMVSGAIMLLTILQQELAQRRYEGSLLQTLGASQRQTKQLDSLEFSLLGVTCGVIAAVIAELLLAVMSARFFELPVTLHPLLWISLPVVATLTFTLTGNLVRSKLSLAQSYRLLKSG